MTGEPRTVGVDYIRTGMRLSYVDAAEYHARVAGVALYEPEVVYALVTAHASLAAAYASLAVVEDLGRFEAVAVEAREVPS
jgi:hypothetical protein